jgi:hypothetical protein
MPLNDEVCANHTQTKRLLQGDSQLLKHLYFWVVVKVVVLILLWWFFVKDDKVQPNVEQVGNHFGSSLTVEERSK